MIESAKKGVARLEKLITGELSPDFDTVEIYPICDLHIGDALADIGKFQKFLEHLKAEPNRYAVCLGDIVNNNIKSSVGSPYEDIISPSQQKKEAKRLLDTVKDRILVMVGGNHEYRTKRETDLDITEDLADSLDVPYCPNEAVVKLSFGTKINKKPRVYTLYVTHGASTGRRPGGTLNRAEEITWNVIADVYLFGHAHRAMTYRPLIRIPDLHNNNLRELDQVIVVAPAWLRYGGFAARKQMRPQPRGYVYVTLYAVERKIVPSI